MIVGCISVNMSVQAATYCLTNFCEMMWNNEYFL